MSSNSLNLGINVKEERVNRTQGRLRLYPLVLAFKKGAHKLFFLICNKNKWYRERKENERERKKKRKQGRKKERKLKYQINIELTHICKILQKNLNRYLVYTILCLSSGKYAFLSLNILQSFSISPIIVQGIITLNQINILFFEK